MSKSKSKRQAKPAARPDPRVSGRASQVYRQLMGPGSRAKAIATIRAALKRAKGRVDIAAGELEVSSRTLSRWLAIEGLREFASSQRAANSIPGPRL